MNTLDRNKMPLTPASASPGHLPPAVLTLDDIQSLDQTFGGQTTSEVLSWAWRHWGRGAAIGTSFQGAGLVMIDLALKAGCNFPVFTLDTGLLFPETIELKSRLEQHFCIAIEALVPDLTVEQQAEASGPDLWKTQPDLCCTMRKVLPLQSKLRDLDCWVTGLRRDQSQTRSGIGIIELYNLDEASGKEIVKLNPMAGWSREAVWKHIHDHKIPYNPLHDRGYSSIGCQPCTLKNTNDKNERAGRWTGFNKVECGIHTFMPRKV